MAEGTRDLAQDAQVDPGDAAPIGLVLQGKGQRSSSIAEVVHVPPVVSECVTVRFPVTVPAEVQKEILNWDL
ncbi:MAG: hypothetical protein EXQ70_03510 [Solirubrobacterales bacterium]|nr:hypothetical protein [Solirubrobacterales bacterium]